MKITIVKTKAQLKEFITIPYLLHKHSKHYIGPLSIMTKSTLSKHSNPLWHKAQKQLFILHGTHNKPIGRIASIFHPDYFEKSQNGIWGYFDCIDNVQASELLLSTAMHFLKPFGCKAMTGPFNPTMNYELGVLVSGFEDKPFFMMNYNHSYYPKLLSASCNETLRYYAYSIEQGFNESKINKIKKLVSAKMNASIVDIDYKNFQQSAKELCTIYNDAFSTHSGFVPFSESEFIYLAKSLIKILNKKMLFKVCVEAEAAGFILAVPNLNEIVQRFPSGQLNLIRMAKLYLSSAKIKSAKIMIAAIKKKYQHTGLGSLLYCEMHERCLKEGYTKAEISWIAADNIQMNKIVQGLGAVVSKEYAIYTKAN